MLDKSPLRRYYILRCLQITMKEFRLQQQYEIMPVASQFMIGNERLVIVILNNLYSRKERESMRGRKRNIAITLIVVILFLSAPLVVIASQTEGMGLRVTLNASRPVGGNPRGTATVRTLDSQSQAIRARVVVFNSNNTTTTPNSWCMIQAPQMLGGLASGTTLTSNQTVGSTSTACVEGQGQRRTISTGIWSGPANPVRSWH